MSNQTAQELQAYVRRVESVEDEINVLNQDKSAIYKEAKANGFNTKTLRKVIAARRMDETERQEQDAEFELYWNAVHGIEPDLVRAHVENIEEFDAETGEITEPQVAPQPAQGSDEAAEPIASQPIQPETANEAGDELVTSPVEAADHGATVGTGNDATTDNPGGSNVAATSAHNVTGEGAHNASVTPFTPKPLRPYCQNPGNGCGGMGRKHCHQCEKAHQEAGAA